MIIRKITSAILRLFLSSILVASSGTGAFPNWDDYRSFSNPQSRINDFQNQNRLHLSARPAVSLPTFNIRTPIAPALSINSYTMGLPEIDVPDIENSHWTFERLTNNFNPQLKSYDHYQANISFKFNDNVAPGSVMMDIGKMKFPEGTQTPERFNRVYKGDLGSSFTKVRTEQKSHRNDGYDRFVQHYQREGKLTHANQLLNPATRPAGIPPEPTLEITESFKEKWTLTTVDEQGRRQKTTTHLSIDSMKYNSGGDRFVTEYAGRLSDNKQTYAFTVAAPHDSEGRITALNIKIEGKGFPTANIEWKPSSQANGAVDGNSADEAFQLLRQNLPVPLFVGPNSSMRLNGVDIVESPLNVTPNGDISPQQLGTAKDLANLMGKEDLGISVSFSPAKEASGGFSLMNSLKNLGYMLTGQWGEVKGLRQEISAMAQNNPAKFLLAAGFSDPGYIGIKDLRLAIDNSKHVYVPSSKIELGDADQVKTLEASYRTGFLSRILEVLTTPVGVAFKAAAEVVKTGLSVVFGGRITEEPLKGYDLVLNPTDLKNLSPSKKGAMDFFIKQKPDLPSDAPSAVFEIRHSYKTPPLINILPHSPYISMGRGESPDRVGVYFNRSPKEFIESLKTSNSIDLFFHGYNVKSNASLDLRTRFTRLLETQGHKNINALISWSGDMGNNFFSKVAFFNRSVKSASLSWEGVAATTDFIRTLNPGIKINATTHSLGAGMLLEAASRGVKFGTVILIVPAVDNEALSPGGKYEKALQNIDQLVVVYSRNQKAVFIPYMLGRFDRALGDVGPSGQVNRPNFVAIDGTNASRNPDYGILVRNHGDIYNEQIINMMTKYLNGVQ